MEAGENFPDMVAWLPPGCALWRSMKKPNALTSSEALLQQIEFNLRVIQYSLGGGKGKKPESIDLYDINALLEEQRKLFLKAEGRRKRRLRWEYYEANREKIAALEVETEEFK